MVFVYDEKSKGDRRVITSVVMLSIGMFIGVSLIAIHAGAV